MLNVAKTKKSNRYCAAINCTNNYRNRPDLSFFRFPRDPERYVTLVLYPQMSKYLYRINQGNGDIHRDCCKR